MVRVHDLPLDHYDVSTIARNMDVTIADQQCYLKDAEIWAYITKRAAVGNAYIQSTAAEDDIVAEIGNLIDSVEISADSQQLCYITDFRFLQSIINQRKLKGAEEQCFFNSEPIEESKITAATGLGAAGANIISSADALAVAVEMDLTQTAVYK